MKKFDSVFKGYESIFAKDIKDLSVCKVGLHKIHTLDVPPIYIPPYRVSMKEREFLKEEVKNMLECGIIEESRSPWSSPVVLIPKKDNTKRFCVDYRKLNAVTITENWPVPRIHDILERLGGSEWFTTLDLASGYWQVQIEPKSREKTAFSTPDGHYQFKRLPFGLKNAPTEFNRIIHRILGHKTHVEVYFDDIIVHSKNFNDHLSHVKDTLSEIKAANLKLKGSKCRWFSKRTKVLGHIISKGKIEMDPEKIEPLKNRAPSNTVKQLQEFLEICNYYRKFVKGFAKVAGPLNDLLKKDNPFIWGKEQEDSFKELKKLLISYPILQQPDFSRTFILHTDASGHALGAVLAQKDDEDNEYACAYASRTLKGAEMHYGITEKECLGVIWAVRQFRIYLYGTKFCIVTDHAALTWLMNINYPTGRLARWAIYLQAYDFDIIHRKGSNHGNADALSRPVLPGGIIKILVAKDEDAYLSAKSLDPFEDEGLLHYLRQKKHLPGTSVKQLRRVEKLAKHFKIEIDNLGQEKLFHTDGDKSLLVPKINERDELIRAAHLLGHFQVETTVKRLQENYFWKGMRKDVERIVKACTICLRNDKASIINHEAKALEISNIFGRCGIDITGGFLWCIHHIMK